jgi:SAM-dependent methyltransferase
VGASLDSVLVEHIAALRCPHCRGQLSDEQGTLRCPGGHSFDIAKQGYVTLVPPVAPGDTAAMIAARVAVQDSGLFAPLATELRRLLESHRPEAELVVDMGSGPGYYASQLATDARHCLCVDSSKYAARRAARLQPSIAAVVADTSRELPIVSACADVVVDVFAPRNAPEFHRILGPAGVLLVAVPAAGHLAGLRARVSMLDVQPGKWQRLIDTMNPHFELVERQDLHWSRAMTRVELGNLVLMGPAAFHTDARALESELEQLPEPFEIEAAIQVACFRRRG